MVGNLVDPFNCSVLYLKLLPADCESTKDQMYFGNVNIYQSGDEGRFDKYEGAIAVLHKDNRMIERFKLVYGDIYEIADGDFVILKRKSAKFIPMYCFYTAFSQNCSKIEVGDFNYKKKTCIVRYQIAPDERLFEDFRDRKNYLLINLFNSGDLFASTIMALKKYGLNPKKLEKKVVQYYSFDDNKEWICDDYRGFAPDIKYVELFYKCDKYKYQSEMRLIYKEPHDDYLIFKNEFLSDRESYINDTSLLSKVDVPYNELNVKDYFALKRKAYEFMTNR